MGNSLKKHSSTDGDDTTHFTRTEIHNLKLEFEKMAHHEKSITKEQFKEIIELHVKVWTGGNIFFERLFDAFDVNGDKTIDVHEFIHGLGIFIKGTPEEKLERKNVSFKFYDLNRDGMVTQKEIIKVLTQLYSAFYQEDRTQMIKEMSRLWFDDLDVNGDGELSFEEYKLSALKEPMIMNFLEQFLIDRPPEVQLH